MPLHFKFALSKNPSDIIVPFVKEEANLSLLRDLTGLKYDPALLLTAKEITSFYHPDKHSKVLVLGLGDAKDASKSYIFFRSIIFHYRTKTKLKVEVICDHLNDEYLTNAVIGLKKGLHNNGTFKTNGNKFTEPEITIIISKKQKAIADQALHIADAQLNTMHLVDHPSNIKTPQYIADFAVKSGKEFGYDVKVYDQKQLKKMKMDALLAVGQGSINHPVFIVMEYKPKTSKSKTPKLGLVGKGISFDTGGISIKPSTNMGYMKCDMAGAAAVLGTIELVARLKLDIHIVAVIPAAENSVDANSIRPGDVISSYSGKSIEVIDTDAEGRLVLADGLAYIIKNHQPEYLIDLATLTGSIVATLGYSAAGLFSKNDEMAHNLSAAGENLNEKVWRLPMWDDYAVDMQSDIADIKNLSGKPVAGAITAAKFLEAFTSEHKNWTHLDIAGVAFTDSEFGKMRTATAYGVRLLYNYIQQLIK
jgi:leucyl aminopeptidase